MKRFTLPELRRHWCAFAFFVVPLFAGAAPPERGSEAALRATMAAIAQGFAAGDVDAVMRYHHPEVTKALSYRKFLSGREAVRADMAGTFASFRVEFVEHEVEDLKFVGEVAVEITRFAVKGTPKAGGEPWVFRGRAMVVYVHWPESPTGWASLREVVQPASD